MSHFTQMKTALGQRIYLEKALCNLGFTVVAEEGGVEVRGFFGATEKAEFKILTATHYDIGFRQTAEGTYEVVGDWDILPKASHIEQEPFMNALKKEYAKVSILDIAETQGYGVEMIENETTGETEIVVKQW